MGAQLVLLGRETWHQTMNLLSRYPEETNISKLKTETKKKKKEGYCKQ